MYYVINRIDLGAKRILGYELFDGKQIIEKTGKQIMDGIMAGEVYCGLKLSESGKSLELDNEGFFTTNMMIHSHIDDYKPMISGVNTTNIMYIIIDLNRHSLLSQR